MNKDYFGLDNDITHMLVTTCIDEFDPTRMQTTTHNQYLVSLCSDVKTTAGIIAVESQLVQLQNSLTKSSLENPTTTTTLTQTTQNPAAPGTKPPSTTPPASTKLTKAQITQVQEKLKSLNLYSGALDGIAGADTTAGVRVYQEQHPPLKATGSIDAATLKSLGVS